MPSNGTRRSHSLARYLLAGIVLPITLFVAVDAVGSYRRALHSINIAYDRSLLASARYIGELLQADGETLKVDLPFAALDIFDAANNGRMYYRISGFKGEFLSGYEDLPAYTRQMPQRNEYAALVDFYDGEFRGERVRMAALYQPVSGQSLRGVALIQVAETLEVRETLARGLLLDTLLRGALLIAIVGGVAWLVVARALRPVNDLRREVLQRGERDLSPVTTPGLPTELHPVVGAINELMQRVLRMVGHQRQFVRDASHQLRTPLAVLKAQAQNGLSGHADARATLAQMHETVDRAIRLANQMLALAKVEQVHGQDAPAPVDLSEIAREVALDLSPLIGEKALDFELHADSPVMVLGHEWMLRELTRNLLHNALRETPEHGALSILVAEEAHDALLRVRDSGPGLSETQREHLFEPFRTGHPTTGSGLGLAICRDVCDRHGGSIELVNRHEQGRVGGLDAIVRLPLAATKSGA
ncbi:sensor histidine kinase [Piscinibacter terrae]|uniref:histidine kinase n=1 Tax=Piscinibacter terrae TaxID=2496871 RepID=A0A3N7IYV4_9BURK|nr:sensor histidine kinase [Albitalea terrae]RQP23912.1 sensor histidine kinase [Albitalea terrae]